jgi:hypothetical protein
MITGIGVHDRPDWPFTITGIRNDVAALQARFAPAPPQMPDVVVNLPPVASYDLLLPSMGEAA